MSELTAADETAAAARAARRRGVLRSDVCVIGGGPAGTAAALSALAAGAVVSVIAPEPNPRRGSLELIAGRTQTTLRTLGLLAAVSSAGERCRGTVIRWSTTEFDEQSSLLDPEGGGWIVDRRRLDSALRAVTIARGISVISARVHGIDDRKLEGRWCVHHRGGSVLADEVILAAGRASRPFRRHMYGTRQRRIAALVAEFEPDAIGGLGRRLLVDRGRDGWWYALADRARTHAVFCTDAGMLTDGRRGIQKLWERACRSAADWLPEAVTTVRPAIRPAVIATATPVVDDGLCLVGDAALSVDPLSGHGITLALQAGSRCRERDYADWVAGTSSAYERMADDVYADASGPAIG